MAERHRDGGTLVADQALYDAAVADVALCRAHYIAAVLAQTEGTEGRLSGKQSLLVARSVLHQALQIRDAARGNQGAGGRRQATD